MQYPGYMRQKLRHSTFAMSAQPLAAFPGGYGHLLEPVDSFLGFIWLIFDAGNRTDDTSGHCQYRLEDLPSFLLYDCAQHSIRLLLYA